MSRQKLKNVLCIKCAQEIAFSYAILEVNTPLVALKQFKGFANFLASLMNVKHVQESVKAALTSAQIGGSPDKAGRSPLPGDAR